MQTKTKTLLGTYVFYLGDKIIAQVTCYEGEDSSSNYARTKAEKESGILPNDLIAALPFSIPRFFPASGYNFLFVINEEMIGYYSGIIYPHVWLLRDLRKAYTGAVSYPLGSSDVVRLATRKDFEKFRISEAGYTIAS